MLYCHLGPPFGELFLLSPLFGEDVARTNRRFSSLGSEAELHATTKMEPQHEAFAR